ncbi:hypothetical protein M8J76_010513 [Diaphorina citri]|nr:hypothetical protein M8J76_010513 [Diaphorina citri]KAI5734137.1 hypothetical protein M8J77_002938 [Diaphorina citri]
MILPRHLRATVLLFSLLHHGYCFLSLELPSLFGKSPPQRKVLRNGVTFVWGPKFTPAVLADLQRTVRSKRYTMASPKSQKEQIQAFILATMAGSESQTEKNRAFMDKILRDKEKSDAFITKVLRDGKRGKREVSNMTNASTGLICLDEQIEAKMDKTRSDGKRDRQVRHQAAPICIEMNSAITY